MNGEGELPGWMRELVEAGRKAGGAAVALASIVGTEVIYAERSLLGLALIESASCSGGRVEVHLLLRPLDGSHDTARATLRYPLEAVSASHCGLNMNGGYGVWSTLVFHPALISHIRDLAGKPEELRQVLDLVRHEYEWPEALRAVVRSSVGLPTPESAGSPRCRQQHGRGRFIVELRDLPIPDGRCFIWSVDNPLIALMAACQVCLPLCPDLMRRLLDDDRAHRSAHPGVAPAVAEDAQELFAHRPELALLYHQRFGGVSLNGNLADRDAIRLLGAVAARCGMTMAPPETLANDADADTDRDCSQNVQATVGADTDAFAVTVQRRASG